MTDFPQSRPPPPPPPPAQRNGCITALMVVVGAILLLPGICGALIAGPDLHELVVDANTLRAVMGLIALGIGGIVLILLAVRRPGH